MTTYQESARRTARHRAKTRIGWPAGEVPAAMYLIGVFLVAVIGAGAMAWMSILGS